MNWHSSAQALARQRRLPVEEPDRIKALLWEGDGFLHKALDVQSDLPPDASQGTEEAPGDKEKHVDALIAREATRGILPERILLAGFSQGGAVTLAAGLARSTPLGGLVALSTYLPMGLDQARASLQPAAASQPLFMGHGVFDPVVPVAGGEAASRAFRDFGFEVQWRRYPMQHSVCAEEIRDLGDWMTARFAAT